MYYKYFGLTEAPFSIAVDPRYLFMSARHRDALAHLLYGIGEGGGFILLTGEVGTGKTTINRCLLQQLPENIDLALILNPALDVLGLLSTMCDELGIEHDPQETRLKILTDKLHHYLLDNHQRGRNTVLLIDEAQHLQPEVLEQIRLLTNLETNTKKLLQIILVGQPELRSMLMRPELRQLSQRITARYDLKALNLQETEAYIQHRLKVAGLQGKQQLFSKSIIKQVHKVCAGTPRLINVLCDRLLLGTYGKNKYKVDRQVLKQAVQEVLGQEAVSRHWFSPQLLRYALGGASLALLCGLAWQNQDRIQQLLPTLGQPETSQVLPVAAASKTLPAFVSRQQALQALYQHLGLADEVLCGGNAIWRCETVQLKSWNELQSYNRPVLVELLGEDKFIRYAVLTAMDDQQAQLLGPQTVQQLPLATLAKQWTGGSVFVWNVESGYQQPIAEGEENATVAWLAKAFAKIDQRDELLSTGIYNDILVQRVKIFQRQNGLVADGVVGIKTLLKINEALELDKPLGQLVLSEQLLQHKG
jgi:general secretion pathway protein A